MALAIFGGNLKTALEEGNMKNIWGGGYDKVDQTSWTSGSTNSNTVVSNTADLDAIVAEAKKTLDDLMAKPQPLSEQDARLAALNLTILMVSGPAGTGELDVYPKLMQENNVYPNTSGMTVIGDNSVTWGGEDVGNPNFMARRDRQSSIDDVVENIRAIKAKFAE